MDFNYFHSMSHFYTTDNAKNIRVFFCMEHWFKIGGGWGWGGGTSWDNLRPKIQTLVAHILLLIIDVMLCKCKITITSVGKLLAVITVKYI